MTKICGNVPPSLGYNFEEGHAPEIYEYFWLIGGICVLIVYVLQIPHLINVSNDGQRLRKLHERVFVSRQHSYVFYLNLMPLLFVSFNYVILLSPSSVYAMNFATHCYEAFAFIVFKRLITLYLNGPENALKEMSKYPPKKIWASFPLCCCWIFCYPCIPHQHLTPSTFRMIYSGVYQFAFLMPVLSFLEVIRGYQGESHLFRLIINNIRLASVILCVYSLFVYMKAANEPLLEYRVRGKFWVMKLTVVCATFIETGLAFLPISASSKTYYDEDVMTSAWASISSIVLLLPLTIFVRRVFNIKDCNLTKLIYRTEDYGGGDPFDTTRRHSTADTTVKLLSNTGKLYYGSSNQIK